MVNVCAGRGGAESWSWKDLPFSPLTPLFGAALPFRSRPNSSCLVGHFPFLSALAGVHLIGNRHYFRPYAWLDRGDENRDDKGGHALRKRPWGREGRASSRMPPEFFCPIRVVCLGKSSATSTRRRTPKN